MGTGHAFDRKSNPYYYEKPEIKPYLFTKQEEDEDLRQELLEDLSRKSSYLTPDEMELIETEFHRLSRNQLIGRNKLLQYFALGDIQETVMATAFLNSLKHTGGDRRFIDWPTFLNFVIILAKGSREERLALIFQMFNIDNSPDRVLTKRNMKQAIWHIFCSLLNVTYEEPKIESLKSTLEGISENDIETAFNLFVEEIFENYGSKGGAEVMTYEQWSKWIGELAGMDQILEIVINPLNLSIPTRLDIEGEIPVRSNLPISPPENLMGKGPKRSISGTNLNTMGLKGRGSIMDVGNLQGGLQSLLKEKETPRAASPHSSTSSDKEDDDSHEQ